MLIPIIPQIDFIYMVAGYMNLTYLSSYVYVVTDLDTKHWNCEWLLHSLKAHLHLAQSYRSF